jgi:hypothetical protein
MVVDFLKKYWFQLLIVVALIIITAVIINNGKKPKQVNSGGGFTPSTDTALDKNKVLSEGMNGPEVKQLQKYINQGYAIAGWTGTITEDGVFGAGTKMALHNLTGQWSMSLNDAEFMLANYNN